MSLKKYLPWSFHSKNNFFATYGDKLLFRNVINTPPVDTNPESQIGVHSAVPHRYVFAYLMAIKSFLRYQNNFCVYVHDDGSLTEDDISLIRQHIRGASVIQRRYADDCFDKRFAKSILPKIRKSYTSYIKLFDPVFHSNKEKIIILDTDTLFLKRPESVLDWCETGVKPWYHAAPDEVMKITQKQAIHKQRQMDAEAHIQTLVIRNLNKINSTLQTNYKIEQGFCSGFIGYRNGTFTFEELEKLFNVLFEYFDEKIFKWGSEQTVHGMLLCKEESTALPLKDYLVFTNNTFSYAKNAIFVHFVGECRFDKFIYPKMARAVIRELCSTA